MTRVRRAAVSVGLRAPGDFLWLTIAWTLFAGVFGVGLLFVVDRVPLGPDFRPAVAVYLSDAALTSLVFVLLISRAGVVSSTQPSQGRRRWTSRRVLVGLGVVSVPAAIWLAGLLVWNEARESGTKIGAASARREFRVFTYGDDLDRARLERTLAAFEQARRGLADEWPQSQDELPIELRLFGDIERLRARYGSEWSAGNTHCQPFRVAVAAPLEEAPSVLWSSYHSGAPLHEMVHAMMYRSLGARAFHLVPLWYHEGMAQLHEDEGLHRTMKRAWVRVSTWLNRRGLPDPESFCGNPGLESPEDVALFYSAAHEFIRSLEARRGRAVLDAVVAGMGSGAAIRDAGTVGVFEDSLRDRLGGTCVELYGEWRES